MSKSVDCTKQCFFLKFQNIENNQDISIDRKDSFNHELALDRKLASSLGSRNAVLCLFHSLENVILAFFGPILDLFFLLFAEVKNQLTDNGRGWGFVFRLFRLV
jgi:hypothetical protein